MADALAEIPEKVKPRLRGVIHQWSFYVGAVLAVILIASADGGRERLAALVYGLGLCGLFGVSALYHRRTWTPRARRNMRRADHSMIFLFIAASYTPFALLVLEGTLATVIGIVVWAGALGGVILTVAWTDAPKWLTALVYVALGWVTVAGTPQLLDELGLGNVLLIALGGLLYTGGAIVYARGRPDPRPETFGYHEIFHVCVSAAAAAHFAVIAFAVL